MGLFQIGIDLGTTRIRVYRPHRGIVYNQPSCVAFDSRRENGSIVAYGEEARIMQGREPEFIRVVFPVQQGVIADYRVCEHLLKKILSEVCGGMLVKPAVALCMPSGVTGVEQYALESAAMEAGARSFLLIEEPTAAALGAGLDLSRPRGRLVIDIGGGSTDACVMSMFRTISRSSCRVAGNALDEAIAQYLRVERGLLVGIQTAEQIKKQYGVACDPDPACSFSVKGRLVNGPPATVTVTQTEICGAMQETLDRIFAGIRPALEEIPPDLAADIAADGFLLTGGGSLLKNLDLCFRRRMGLRAMILPETDKLVAKGTAGAFRFVRQRRRGENAPLRMQARPAGIPEMGLRRADEKEKPLATRPEWFYRDASVRPDWHAAEAHPTPSEAEGISEAKRKDLSLRLETAAERVELHPEPVAPGKSPETFSEKAEENPPSDSSVTEAMPSSPAPSNRKKRKRTGK